MRFLVVCVTHLLVSPMGRPFWRVACVRRTKHRWLFRRPSSAGPRILVERGAPVLGKVRDASTQILSKAFIFLLPALIQKLFLEITTILEHCFEASTRGLGLCFIQSFSSAVTWLLRGAVDQLIFRLLVLILGACHRYQLLPCAFIGALGQICNRSSA